jgi:hypothetical protein
VQLRRAVDEQTDGRTQSAKKLTLSSDYALQHMRERGERLFSAAQDVRVFIFYGEKLFSRPPCVWIIQILGLFIARRGRCKPRRAVYYVCATARFNNNCLLAARSLYTSHTRPHQKVFLSLWLHTLTSVGCDFFIFLPRTSTPSAFVCFVKPCIAIAL